MPSLNDVRAVDEIRYVSDIHFELGGAAHATVRTGVLGPNGFVETDAAGGYVLSNQAPAALGTTVADFLARNNLSANTLTVRQLIRAAVNEAMQAP